MRSACMDRVSFPTSLDKAYKAISPSDPRGWRISGKPGRAGALGASTIAATVPGPQPRPLLAHLAPASRRRPIVEDYAVH